MVLVGVDHGIPGKLAAAQRQESGGKDLPRVADEHHALAVADPQGSPMKRAGVAAWANRCRVRTVAGMAAGANHSRLRAVAGFAAGTSRSAAAAVSPGGHAGSGQGIAASLQHPAAVVRGFSRLNAVRLPPALTPQTLEDHLVLLRRDPLLVDAPADRHQEEDRPHGDALVVQQLRHGLDLVEVPPRNRGVDLHGQIEGAGVGHHPQGPLEAARPAAKSVVRGGVGTIKTDA